MAADVKARHDKTATLAFTLPISCQVCLGKVKDPVLCPNNHAFCGQCMDVWLQRNKQCPACRVPINPGNPIRKILGGLNQSGEDKERLSNPDLRKARFDLLFKEYEEEFERLSSEVNLLKTENEVLQQQLQRTGSSSQSRLAPQASKQSEANGVLVLNKKLQDAQKLYEKVKSELSKVKQENNALKDENVNLNRENQKLRQEIANRSPHRYGRYTVATLESKVKDQEKEISQLNKALERSDKLIEDLQKEVEEYRGSGKSQEDKLSLRDYTSYQSRLSEPYSSSSGSSTARESSENHKRQLFGNDYHGDEEFRQSSQKDYINGESYDSDDEHAIYRHKSYDPLSNHRTKNGAKGTKRVTFDLPKDKNETVSFDLEMPSPLKGGKNLSNGTTPSPVKGVLKNGKRGLSNGDDSSFNLSKPGSLDDSYADDRRMTLSARYSKEQREEDALVSKYSRSSRYSKDDDEIFTRSRSRKPDLDVSGLSESFNLENPSRVTDHRHDRYSRELDDTEAIENELDDLDISMTPDFTDCMKLLNRAEKKVHSDFSKKDPRDEDSLLGNLRSADDFLSEYKPSQRIQTKTDFSENYKPTSRTVQYSSSLPEGKYSSKYYPSEDYKPTTTSTKSEFDIPSSRFSGNSDPISSRYQTSVIPNSSEFKPSASRDFLAPSNKTSDTISEKYPLASDKYATSGELAASTFRSSVADNFNIPASTTQYSTSTTDFQKYKIPNDAVSSTTTSLYNSVSVSTPSKFSSSASSKPLGQSFFSRSPSLDNLYMQSKPTQSLGSRFATAEDVPSDYRSRASLPLYDKFSSTDGQGRLQSAATHTTIGSGKDYITSALPPKPVRLRSQSDMGTSVSSFASSSTHTLGKGNNFASAITSSGGGGINDPNAPYDPPSQYLPPPSTSQHAPNMLVPSSNIPSNPSLSSNSSAPFIDSARYTNALPSKLEVTGNSATNIRLTNGMSNPNGPMKATTGYSYTDFDLGVNPRHKSKIDLPLTSRTRSNSLDIPINLGNRASSSAIDNRENIPNSQFSNSNSSYAYDRTDIDRPMKTHLTSSSAALTNHDTAYAVSLTGASSGPVTMETNPGNNRYGSSLSSSATYLTSSLTSVTSSNTYSTARSTTAPYPSSSSSLPSSTYSSQSLRPFDPIQEPSGKGYMYLSNTSSLGDHGDGSRTDSFLPEPKKRLFDSTDDMDMSLSPIKATKTS